MKTQAVLAGVILLLAGCASPQPAATGQATPVEPPSVSPAATTPAPASPSETQAGNERGNVVKKLGETAYLETADGATLAKFKITKIQVDPKCTGAAVDKPQNGHYIAVTMDIQTTAALAEADDPAFSVMPAFWKVISPEGVTENDSDGNAYSCMAEKDLLPGRVGPGEHVKGIVVLDSAHTSGGLVLLFDLFESRGWEWGF